MPQFTNQLKTPVHYTYEKLVENSLILEEETSNEKEENHKEKLKVIF